MTALRREIDALCEPYGDVVVIEHDFKAEGAYRAGDGPGYAAYGWGTSLTPVGEGQRVWIWFDGLDRDVVVDVGGIGWFEWRDLSDEDGVRADIVGLCSGVLAGQVWAWRTRRTRGCEVQTPDGRLLRATRHGIEPVFWPEWGTRRVRARQQLSGYPTVAP